MNSQNVSLSNYDEDEDYIDMELSSSSIQTREFEFQMSLISSTTFPADDLFCDGKLLPLHHLPRRHTTTPCNIHSPPESCRVSCDDDNYFFEWSNELNAFIHNNPTKTTWFKKIKDSIFGTKAYLKTLFHNSSRKFQKVPDKIERRSFSSAIKGLSSSSFSVNYNGEVHYFLRRSSSATEIEGSIEAAIAHCKKSQHILHSATNSVL